MSKEKPVQVIYILTQLELGGAQKIALTLLQGVQQGGLSTALISGTKGPLVARAQKLGKTVLLDSFVRSVGVTSLMSELKTFFSLVRILRKYKKAYADLTVHTHSTKAGILGRWAAFFAGVRNRVHTVHGFSFHPYQSRLVWLVHVTLEWITSLITTRYICVSHKDRDTGIRLFPRFARTSTIIRAAVDTQHFFMPARHSKHDANFTFGVIGCFKPQKNLFDLLHAFHHVHSSLSEEEKKKTRLQIIGDGLLRDKIEAWIEKHNLIQAIDLLGWQDDVAPFLKRWDVMVSSSLWEGLPCALVDASCSNLSVIANDVGGVAEVIKDNKNGFIIRPRDREMLGKRMLEVVLDRHLLSRLANYDDDLSAFSNATMIEQHLAVYRAGKTLKNKF